MIRRIKSGWQKIPLAVPFAAVVIGICCDRVLALSNDVLSIWVGTTLVLSLLCCFTKWRWITFVILFSSNVGLMAAWHHLNWHAFSEDEISLSAPSDHVLFRPVCLEVIACEQPKIVLTNSTDVFSTVPSGDQTKFLVRVKSIRNGKSWCSSSGQAVLAVDGHLLSVNSGDRLQVFAKLSRIPPATNPGEFNFRKHARAERRLCQLRAPYPDCVEVVSKAESQGFYQLLQRIRGRCQTSFATYLDRSTSELASALLLGLRDQLPREQIDSFFLTGTMHLLAISGLHVGILAFGFFFAARRGLIPYRLSLLAVMAFVLAYALLTEARPPVLRAAVLIQVICISWLTRRRPSVFNSLLFAATLVLLWNPMELFRVGAQLSFLAVATLCWLSPHLSAPKHEDPLDHLIWMSRPWHYRAMVQVVRWARNMLIASAGVWLMTLPLTMARFHVVTPYAILLNLALLPPISVALFSGISLLFFAEFIPPMAIFAGAICNTSLHLLQGIVSLVVEIPGSHFWVAGSGEIGLAIFYGSSLIWAISPWRPNRRWLMLLMILWFSFPMTISQFSSARNAELRCTFVDVGHGTCVLIELPDNRALLYDCGQMGIANSGVASISAVLWSRRVSHLDAVILSHADADHYNALPGLLERFSVGVVYVGPEMFAGPSDAVAVLQRVIVDQNVPIRTIADGKMLRLSDGLPMMSFLHPPPNVDYQDDNERSLVLSIEYGGRRILLPGDIEGRGLERFLVQPIVDYDLMMAAHHGSLHSSPAKFVEWASPEITVVSSGFRPDSNRSIAIFETLRQSVFFTGIDGAVFLDVSGEGALVVRSFLDSSKTFRRDNVP